MEDPDFNLSVERLRVTAIIQKKLIEGHSSSLIVHQVWQYPYFQEIEKRCGEEKTVELILNTIWETAKKVGKYEPTILENYELTANHI
ncbi:MAG: hypothetical protein QNJ54_11140 [Prochloraceae cyanobacterium]|nr:hypothetical protein [Prochloraceae cyanobacterium]